MRFQIFGDPLSAMRWPTIPDENEPFAQMSTPVLQSYDDIRALDRMKEMALVDLSR
jgi:hypothetical protein